MWIFALAASALALQPATKLTPPPVVAPGAAYSIAPPADAVVLFDGKSLNGWTKPDGKPAAWKIEEGVLTAAPGAGNIISTATFGDAQIHIEFRTPVEQGDGQDRGNSGAYLQGRYEVQVLDSFKSETYPDGQCGAIYKQHVPLVNACRPQGEWQTYDIIFRAPKFENGKKSANATLTVFHNGVLIHDHAEATSPTGSAMSQEEKPVGPLLLQEHGHAVGYRNIWIRRL